MNHKKYYRHVYAMAAIVAMACSFLCAPANGASIPEVVTTEQGEVIKYTPRPDYALPSHTASQLDTIYVDATVRFSRVSPSDSSHAQTVVSRGVINVLDTIYIDHNAVTYHEKTKPIPESFFPNASRDLSQTWFTWGADIGASIDMSTDDMSTFDINAYFGYRNRVIRTLGFGAGVHQAFGNSHTFIPVYAMLRTYFTSRPSMFFGEIKGGYSFNTIAHDHSQGGAYFNAGVGINLAHSRHFQSHIILSYGWMGMKPFDSADDTRHGKHLNYATLRLGISF